MSPWRRIPLWQRTRRREVAAVVERVEAVESDGSAAIVDLVLALPMRAEAMERFRTMFGPNIRIRDIKASGLPPALVATPPLSPQGLAALRGLYPTADIVIVELDDWDLGVTTSGPITRALSAGATAYYVADSAEQLVTGVTEMLTSRSLRIASDAAREIDPAQDD